MADDLPIIEEALEEVLEELAALPTSPRVREMKVLASKYQRTVKQWANARPTPTQSAAMLECVMTLHVEVRGRVTARPPPAWDPVEEASKGNSSPPGVKTKRPPKE